MGSSSDMMGSGMSAGPVGEEETVKYLKDYRYVDKDLKPLSESDSPPFAEFNMMPVCLELIVDQRKLPDILVECANSTMPIDIKLVRYNPAYAKTGILGGSMGGGMGGMMGSGMGGMSGSSGMGGGGGGSMSGGGSSMPGGGPSGGMGGTTGSNALGAATDALSGFEVGGKIGVYGSDAVMVQIVGVIYIYNEPDTEQLATGASAQESGLESGVSQEVLEQIGGAMTENVETDTTEFPLAPPETATDDSDEPLDVTVDDAVDEVTDDTTVE
jgi:hypothetical protein